jgi:hypothetical protein
MPVTDAGAPQAVEADTPAGGYRPVAFVILCFGLSVPFWALGAFWTRPLLPGLPSTALMFVCPAGAAAILAARAGGWRAVTRLLAGAVDFRRIHPWDLAGLLILVPALAAVLSWLVIRMSGAAIPPFSIDLGRAVLLAPILFIAAAREEIGWSGYLTSPFIARFGLVGAGLGIGVIWAVFHFVALGQVHRSLEWIAWWSLGTIATRVIMVQLYARTGRSVAAVTLLHVMVNLGWQLFPGQGAWFNPAVNGVIMTMAAVAVVLPSAMRRGR